MKDVYLIIVVATATLFGISTADDELKTGAQQAKLISTFQIVRFPNEGCTGSSTTRNGTCYTSAECSDKGGTSQGSCADGFGVCCIFVITDCESSVSENITYWDSPSTVTATYKGDCTLKVGTINDHICQLRLDFTTFVITGPSTAAVSEANMQAGMPFIIAAADTNDANWSTNCLVDVFSISSPNPANKPPILCGINNGMHMYVDMDSDTMNVLSFAFEGVPGPANTNINYRGVGAIANRDWDMTITQFECGYINAAPPGCTQYLWSDTGAQIAGWLISYNFQASGSKHLANQNQKICIRREKAVCWAAFYKFTSGVFTISGKTTGGALAPNAYYTPGVPCGYKCEEGAMAGDADNACGYDCVIIPGAFGIAAGGAGTIKANPTFAEVRAPTTIATNHSPAIPQLASGGDFATDAELDGVGATAGSATDVTLYTQQYPFTFIFKSDGYEGLGGTSEFASAASSLGFKMSYDLIPCTA